MAVERADGWRDANHRRRCALGLANRAIDRLDPAPASSLGGRSPFAGQVPGLELGQAGPGIDQDGRVIKRHADIGHPRVTRRSAGQPFQPGRQVVADEPDQAALERRGVGRRLLRRVRQSEAIDEPSECRQWIALARRNGFRVGRARPARPGGFEDQPRLCGQHAPAAGVAEAGPALQDRRLGPRPDHRGEPVGRHVQHVLHDVGASASRHEGSLTWGTSPRYDPRFDHREIRRFVQARPRISAILSLSEVPIRLLFRRFTTLPYNRVQACSCERGSGAGNEALGDARDRDGPWRSGAAKHGGSDERPRPLTARGARPRADPSRRVVHRPQAVRTREGAHLRGELELCRPGRAGRESRRLPDRPGG